MSGLDIAQRIASAARGSVVRLPTGPDQEYAVVLEGIAIVLVREFRSNAIGVSVLAQRAWSPRTIEETATAIRESASLARAWVDAHENGVTALDVAIEGTKAIIAAHGSAPMLETPGGQQPPTEMWMGDIGIFQEENSVKIPGCGKLSDRKQLATICAKMVRKIAEGEADEKREGREKDVLDTVMPQLADALNRFAPPAPNATWTLSTPNRPERTLSIGSWDQNLDAIEVKFVENTLVAHAGLWGSRGFDVEGLEMQRDLPDIIAAVQAQLSVLTPYRLEPGRNYRVLLPFADVAAGEILRYREPLREDHQPNTSIFDRLAQPEKEVHITHVWEVGRDLDRYLTPI